LPPEPDKTVALKAKEFVTKADEAREQFRYSLAFWLLFAMLASFVMHYTTVLVLELTDRGDAVDSLTQIFHSWLPVVSGFVGTSVAYYFAKQGTAR
jgi:hypothetical protein